MLKKTLKKALAFTLAGVLAFGVAPIAAPTDTNIALAAAVTKGTAQATSDSSKYTGTFASGTGNVDVSSAVIAGTSTPAAGITMKGGAFAGDGSEQEFQFATSAVAPGTYTVTVEDGTSTFDYTLTVLANPVSSNKTATVLPGETVQTQVSNCVGDLTVEYASANGSNLGTGAISATPITGKDVAELFTLTQTGSGSTKTLNITPKTGKVVPGIYTFEFVDKVTGYTLSDPDALTITVKPYDLGSSASVDLGLTDSGVAYFKGINQGYSVDGTDNNVATSVTATAGGNGAAITGVRAVGDYFAKVDFTAASSVGGTKAYVINGADGKKYGTLTLTTSDKSKLTGIAATATVLEEKEVSLMPVKNATDVNYDADKITVVDKAGNTVDMTAANHHFAYKATPTGFITTNEGDAGNKATIKVTGKVAGATKVEIYACKAANHAAGDILAKTTVDLTVVGKSAISITDEKGVALGGDSALSLDMIKNTSKKVTITTPAGTTPTVTSANTAVAEAAADGTITAKGVGRTTITVATAKTDVYDAMSKTFDVVVTAKPANDLVITDETGLTISKLKPDDVYIARQHNAVKLDLMTRKEATLSVKSDDPAAQLKFATDSSYFTVDAFTGKITTKANTTGTGYVTITSSETASVAAAACKVFVSVTEKPEDVITTKANSVKIAKGKTYDLEAKSAAEAKLTYSSSASDKVAVDANGKITAVAATAGVPAFITITAAATDKTILTQKIVEVTVTEYGDNDIVVKKVDDSSVVGDELKITGETKITVSATGNPAITVGSANSDIVSVSLENGVYTLTPGTNGSAIIVITAAAVNDGTYNFNETTRYLVVSYGKVEGTITADESVSVKEGSTAQINASASNGNPVEFTALDPKVATVDASGLVTGVKAGSTVVILSATDCKQAFVKITVTAKKANPIKVTAKKVTIKAGKSVKISKVLKIKSAKGKKTYAKKSGNKNITVNKTSGKVKVKKGTKAGSYKIKISVKAAGNSTYKAKTVTKTVTIKVK